MLVFIYTDAFAVRLKWVACENHAVQDHSFCKCSPVVIVKNCHLISGLYVVFTWNEWVWQPIWVFFVRGEGLKAFLAIIECLLTAL